MRFRRKSDPAPDEPAGEASVEGTGDGSGAEQAPEDDAPGPAGPLDADALDPARLEGRVDLGALLIAPPEGLQLRMQVDDSTQEVQAVLLAGADGALELMPFAAPRGDDALWDEVRPELAADMSQRGGTVDEAQGPWGTELACRLHVKTEDGSGAVQPSRIIGISGPRWMLRATLLGRPALDPESAATWEQVLADVVVRRGTEPRGVGERLPIVLPPHARPLEQS